MVTAAAATAAKAPDVKALQQKLDPLAVRRAALARRLQEIFHLVSPHRLIEGAEAGTRADRLRARAEEPQVRAELALLDAEIEETEHALAAARDAEQLAARERAWQALRPHVPELDRALTRVVEILRPIVALDQAAGAGVTTAWQLLLDEPHRESVLAAWRRYVREAGLLD